MSGKHECPRCKKQRCKVEDTRWSKKLRAVRRRLLCLECGMSFATVEVSVQRYLSLVKSTALVVKLEALLEKARK